MERNQHGPPSIILILYKIENEIVTLNYYLDRFSRAESDPLWMDRPGSLIGFSESPENMNIVNADILNGIWMTNDYI